MLLKKNAVDKEKTTYEDVANKSKTIKDCQFQNSSLSKCIITM